VSFFLDNWILFGVALTSGLLLLWPALTGGGGAGTLNPNEAVLLMNREKAQVVDVCEPSEFAAGHILGAKNVPLAQLKDQLAQNVKNKETPLILVCASGMRSRGALAIAKQLGYTQARSLAGGMNAWRTASLPVQKKTV
jgi:rhodanese-related sulfurtransferase